MRFVTGSSVCTAHEITVEFNWLTGLAQVPIGHTCSCTLELPTSYVNLETSSRIFGPFFQKRTKKSPGEWTLYN